MKDQKPPRLAAGELETVRALLQYQRESLVRKVDGLSDLAAGQQLVTTGTTLLWLVKHIANAERSWVLRSFAGREIASRDDAVGAGDSLATLVEFYRATWAEVDAIIDAASSLDETCQRSGDEPVSLRWILLHLLEETARHAGHADILRELIDGETGR